jgi:hypothetical protein
VTRALERATLALCALVAVAPPARAQDSSSRLDIGAGVRWAGRATLGSPNATETTSSGGTLALFSTSSELSGAGGVALNVAVRVTRRVQATAVATFAKPQIRTTITNDTESSGSVTATETIKEYSFGGGALVYLPDRGARLRPFVAGSISYLRQLHENDTLAVTGTAFQIGGGAEYLFGSRGRRLKGFGLRMQAAVEGRRKGVAFGSGTLFSPVAEASLFARF